MRTALLVTALCLAGGTFAVETCAKDAAKRPPRQSHLELQVDRAEHDFGVAGQNQSLTTKFVITNTTDKKVSDLRTTADCGCNRAELSTKELGPGERATLEVAFDTAVLSGQLLKRVRVYTRDRSKGEIVLRLKVSIVAGLILDPGAVSFRDVVKGTLPTAQFGVKWFEGAGKPFEVTKVEIPGHEENFSTRVAPYKPANGDKWRGFLIDVTFKKAPPLGMYSAHVLVRTTHPKYKRLELPLSANVVGKVWLQQRVLHFGVVEQGKTRTATLKFRPNDTNALFGEVSAKCRSGLLTVETKRDPYRPESGLWVLSATVPTDAKVGRLDNEVIELRTGVQGEEVILIQVRGRVRKPR